MDTRNIVLALCGCTAFVGLATLFIWNFMLGGSLRRMLLTFTAVLVDRDSRVDPNQPVDVSIRPEEMEYYIEEGGATSDLDFAEAIAKHYEEVPEVEDALKSKARSTPPTAQAAPIADPTVNPIAQENIQPSRWQRVVNAVRRPFRFRRYQPDETPTP